MKKTFFKAIINIGGATMKEWKDLTLTDDQNPEVSTYFFLH